MMTLNDNQIREIKKLVGYKGRKVHQRDFRPGMSLNSYWSGGSRDYFFYVAVSNFSGSRVVNTVPQNGTPFDKLNLKAETLEQNVVIVEKSIIGGRDASITIYS